MFLPPSATVTPDPLVTPSPTPVPTASPTPKPETTPTADYATPSKVYFLLTLADGTTGLVPVQRESFMPADLPAETLQTLLDGPAGFELAGNPPPLSQIPKGTRLVRLDMSGPVAHVALSRAFLAPNSAEATLQRIAQVVYTLTQFPAVTAVSITVDSAVVAAHTSAGVLRRPLKRTDFSEQLPAIFVDAPAWGSGHTGSPLQIQGYANVYEAQFIVQVRDLAGTVLAAQVVTATCGTGCWGTFLTSLPYSLATPGWGSLRAYNASAKDGTPENERIYPLMLAPGQTAP